MPEILVRELAVMQEAEWALRDQQPKWRWRNYAGWWADALTSLAAD